MVQHTLKYMAIDLGALPRLRSPYQYALSPVLASGRSWVASPIEFTADHGTPARLGAWTLLLIAPTAATPAGLDNVVPWPTVRPGE